MSPKCTTGGVLVLPYTNNPVMTLAATTMQLWILHKRHH